MLGFKIPFGSSDRVQAQKFASQANQIESEERLVFERERVLAELDAAKARVESAQIRLTAAKRRAQLSAETREFFDKSFKFGESDLPTRLRIELEAVDATKQAAQAEIAYLASVSALRQALGLLPE
jgi:cobalt-zinc-cadmium efflux system outer membrane protein